MYDPVRFGVSEVSMHLLQSIFAEVYVCDDVSTDSPTQVL